MQFDEVASAKKYHRCFKRTVAEVEQLTRLLAEGNTFKAIAKEMNLSLGAVAGTVKRLGLNNGFRKFTFDPVNCIYERSVSNPVTK